jgi:predicted DNA-binding WGR domain protein
MSGQIRRFEFNDGKSSKFWEIEVTGAQFAVRYGKIGTAGQVQTKEFADAAAAGKAADKLIAEKIGKGYQEVGGASPMTPASITAATAPKVVKAPKLPKPTKAKTPAELAKDPETPPETLGSLVGTSETIDRALAKHPKASADLLEKLSHNSDETTRRNVVLSPNASKDVLVRLAPQFPADFFKNPAFDWLLLEEPDLLKRIGGGVMKNILKRPECPQSFLTWAAEHGSEEEMLAVTMNPKAPTDALQRLLKQKGKVAAAAKNHTLMAKEAKPIDLDQEFENAVRSVFSKLNYAAWLEAKGDLTAAQLPLCNATLTKRIAKEELRDKEVIAACEKGHFYFLADKKVDSACVRKSLPSRILGLIHPKAPIEALIKRSKSVEWVERFAIARNPSTPQNIIDMLTSDSHQSVAHQAKATAIAKTAAADRVSSFLSEGESAVDNSKIVSELAQRIKSCWSEWQLVDTRWNRYLCLFQWVSRLDEFAMCAIEKTLQEDMKSELGLSIDQTSNLDVTATTTQSAAILAVIAEHSKNARALEMVARRSDTPWEVLSLLAKREGGIGQIGRAGLAVNPATPVEVLKDLALDDASEVRRGVAINPVTPDEILVLLAKDKNHGVRHNVAHHPATPVEVRTQVQIGLAKDKDIDERCYIAQSSDSPVILAILAKDEVQQVRRDVAKNPAAPIEVLTALAKDKETLVRWAVAENPASPVEVLTALSKHKSEFVRQGVATNPTVPADVLSSLATDEVKDVRCAVANNPATPAIVLSLLAQDQSKEVRRAVGTNPATLLESLSLLAKDVDSDVRKVIARNPATPVEVLSHLAKDEDGGVCCNVAENPTTPLEVRNQVLTKLAQSKDRYYRNEVAKDPVAPPDAMNLLAQDEVSDIRRQVAKNPVTPRELLAVLSKDGDLHVRTTVIENSSTPIDVLSNLAKDEASDVRRKVARNPATPSEVLAELSKDENSYVRSDVITNPATPTEVRSRLLHALATSESSDDRIEAAKNPSTPAKTLAELAKAMEIDVRNAVAVNPSTPMETLVAIAEDQRLHPFSRLVAVGNPRFPEARTDLKSIVLKSIKACLLEPEPLDDATDDEYRTAFGALDLLPDESDKKAIAKAVKSNDWLARFAATYVLGIQPSLLKSLLEDSEIVVKQRAVACLKAMETRCERAS